MDPGASFFAFLGPTDMRKTKIEIRAVRAAEIDGAAPPARYIARLSIEAQPAPVVTFIYFETGYQGAPLTAQETDSARGLVFRALVAGSIREMLRVAARRLDSGASEKIKFSGYIDLDRRRPPRAIDALPAPA